MQDPKTNPQKSATGLQETFPVRSQAAQHSRKALTKAAKGARAMEYLAMTSCLKLSPRCSTSCCTANWLSKLTLGFQCPREKQSSYLLGYVPNIGNPELKNSKKGVVLNSLVTSWGWRAMSLDGRALPDNSFLIECQECSL